MQVCIRKLTHAWKPEGTGAEWPKAMALLEKKKEKLLPLSLFFASNLQAYGAVPPTSLVGLPSSIGGLHLDGALLIHLAVLTQVDITRLKITTMTHVCLHTNILAEK